MSEEHVVDNVVIDDRGLVHQCGDFPPGASLLDPFKKEDESVHRAERNTQGEFGVSVGKKYNVAET